MQWYRLVRMRDLDPGKGANFGNFWDFLGLARG